MSNARQSSTGGTSTQYSTYDDTVDGSGSERDSDDGYTIRSFADAQTPTNSLVSFKVPSRSSNKDNAKIVNRELDLAQNENPGYQLASVIELEETERGHSTRVVGSPGSLLAERSAGGGSEADQSARGTSNFSAGTQHKRMAQAGPSKLQESSAPSLQDAELLDQVQELPSLAGVRSTTDMISSNSASIWMNHDYKKEDNDADDVQAIDPSSAMRDMEAHDQQERDKRILEQLGYSEVLGRDYGFWASFSVGYCVIGGFQGAILSTYVAWIYGGPKMILIMWPVMTGSTMIVICTAAELVSAYPVAGAMATWTWVMAKRGVGGERYWGWLMGGIVAGYHIASICLLSWLIGRTIHETIHMAVASYPKKNYAPSLYALAILVIQATVGSRRWGRSPRFWVMGALLTFIVWGSLCIAMLANRPSFPVAQATYKAPYVNQSGWNSKAMVYLVGAALTAVPAGQDSCAHLAEETRNPARTVPLAMVTSYIVSATGGYILIVVILCSVHPSWIEEIITHEFPPGQVLNKVLGHRAAVAFCSLAIVVLNFQALATLQASSRFLWALSRDQAIPFSRVFYRVSRDRLPVAATWLAVALAAPMTAVLWISPAIVSSVLYSASGTYLTFSYLLTLIANVDLAHESRSSWSLRWMSKPMFVFAVCWGLFLGVLVCLPVARPITVLTFSWGPLTFPSGLVLSYITWKLYGSKHYIGPIKSITRWTAGAELDVRQALDQSSKQPSTGTDSSTPGGDLQSSVPRRHVNTV